MIHWALPIGLVAVGLLTDWRPSALVDTCWVYNMSIIGLMLLITWRKIPQIVSGWKIATLFSFCFIWPIVRAYGGGAL